MTNPKDNSVLSFALGIFVGTLAWSLFQHTPIPGVVGLVLLFIVGTLDS